MKLYYYSNGDEQLGPFSYEELQKENIHPGSLIWYHGLESWIPAKDLEELNDLLDSTKMSGQIISAEGPLDAPPPAKMPKNYLVESILATIFCCLPLGIVGIINAAKVESAWNAGDVNSAMLAAEQARKWTRYSFISGIVVVVLYVLYFVVVFGLALGSGF